MVLMSFGSLLFSLVLLLFLIGTGIVFLRTSARGLSVLALGSLFFRIVIFLFVVSFFSCHKQFLGMPQKAAHALLSFVEGGIGVVSFFFIFKAPETHTTCHTAPQIGSFSPQTPCHDQKIQFIISRICERRMYKTKMFSFFPASFSVSIPKKREY